MRLRPDTARVWRDGVETEVPIAAVELGHVSVKPVTKFAVTLMGPVMVTVVDGAVAFATGPVHPLNE